MPRPVIRRASGRCFDASIAVSRLEIFFSPKPSMPSNTSARQPVQVGHILDQPALDEQLGLLLADAGDIHRPARHKVLEPAHQLGRADAEVRAAVGHLALGALQRRAAGRAALGHVPRAARCRRAAPTIGPMIYGMTSPARLTVT